MNKKLKVEERIDADAAEAMIEEIVTMAEELKAGLHMLPNKHALRSLEVSMDVLHLLWALGKDSHEAISVYLYLRGLAPKSGFNRDLVFSPRERLVRDLHMKISRVEIILKILKRKNLLERTSLKDSKQKVVGACYRVFGCLPGERV